jgi:acetolactate synthase-1/2/3 large subunit
MAEASMSDQPTRRGSEYVYDALVDAGVELLVGLPGTQTLPLDRAVAERDDMTYVMCRHETAIPHVAWGYNEVSGRTAATLTVPGPGDTNAMHGLKNATEDCVPILHVSADAAPEDRGKGPIHEIDPETFDHAVKANVNVERPMDLREEVARGIELAHTPPSGPVRLGVPSSILDSEFAAPPVSVEPERAEYDTEGEVSRAADLLAGADRPVIYVGGGARRSPEGVRVVSELADALDAPVAASYKGKGIFPEDDPRFLGVTGSHFPAGAERVLDRADVVLALGTDFDGVTTAHWELPMGETLVHVNLAPEDIGAAYEADVPIVGDVTAVGDALLDDLDGGGAGGWDGSGVSTSVREEYYDSLESEGLYEDGPPLQTPRVLREVRESTPGEAVVTTDVGGFRLWSMQVFETYRPDRFVSAGSWAGMGVGLPAAVGAGLAEPEVPIVCLTGDGGLLMCIHELATAVEEGIDLTLVVSNNRDYGVISKSPAIEQYTEGHRFTWETPDYARIAEGFGCAAVRAETADELRDAVAESVGSEGPTLIDVAVRTDEPTAAEAADYDSTIDLP